MIDPDLLRLLACPRCRGPIEASADGRWLLCTADALAFPYDDGIACLVEAAARPLAELSLAGGPAGD
jgi:uncharacterized protein YbaR (Trm112 family)